MVAGVECLPGTILGSRKSGMGVGTLPAASCEHAAVPMEGSKQDAAGGARTKEVELLRRRIPCSTTTELATERTPPLLGVMIPSITTDGASGQAIDCAADDLEGQTGLEHEGPEGVTTVALLCRGLQ